MLVLGLHFGHGAAAALVEDGRVVAAVEEEKLNRNKGYVGFPFLAVEHVLERGGVEVADVDWVAIGAEDIAEFSYNPIHVTRTVFRLDDLVHVKASYLLALLHYAFGWWDSSPTTERLFYHNLARVTGIVRTKVTLVNHHLAHAASAFYCSPWSQAVIITADGKGDGLCGGVYLGDELGLHCLDQVPNRYSVGQMYQAVTKFLGYRPNRHEGKITGLAAYGDSAKTLDELRAVLGVDGADEFYNRFYEDELLERDPSRYYSRRVVDKSYMSSRQVRLLGRRQRPYGVVHQLYQNYLAEHVGDSSPQDLAAGIQYLTEELITGYAVRQLKGRLPCKVCLAGGVFANVKVNQRIREIEGVEGLYVQPAMDDAGCALGAALQVVAEHGHLKRSELEVYQGPEYSQRQLEERIRTSGLVYDRPANPEAEVARLLNTGRVIGRYSGRLEWGPRALGNRSILVRPTDKSINDILNKRLKRTEFMPFAPSILAEATDEYLVGYREADIAARYMTTTYEIRRDKIGSIAAAVHVDGTARPQVVFAEDNAEFHRIITEYQRRSGIPAIVNTSFNMHEQPIVSTPDDAIAAFRAGAVDVLSMGPFIVRAADCWE